MSSLKRMILNIVLVNIMLFFALIAIHEISHVILGVCLDCESEKAVLFDSSFNGPHTELICGSRINEFLVYIGGLLITSVFSLSFLFLDSIERKMSFLSLGVSVILSSLDISLILNSSAIIYPLLTFGFFLITVGEYSIASSYFKEDLSFDFLKNRKLLLEE